MGCDLEKVMELGEEVFSTLHRRYADGTFSRDLWRKMGKAGLFGLTVSKEYAGSDGDPSELAETIREFTRIGCDLGLALCWITHLSLCIKYIELLGSEEQKRKYLPGLVSGELVGAAAFSEPETGAHPGSMKTVGVKEEDGFVLDGKKIYITGGTVADIVVVLAVTGRKDESGKNELTAFLVEPGEQGFKTERMELNFLRTAPHAEMTFENVTLSPDSVLGKAGEGHSKASRSAFARERALVLSALCGMFKRGSDEVSSRYRQKYESFKIEGMEAGSWIHHLSALDAYEILTTELARRAFSKIEDWMESLGVLIYMGLSYAKWAYWLEEFVSKHGLDPTHPLDIILTDIKLVLVNEGLLFKEGWKRYLR